MNRWDVKLIPLPDEPQTSPSLVEQFKTISVWNPNTQGMNTKRVRRQEGKNDWMPTPQGVEEILALLRAEFPKGSFNAHKIMTVQSYWGGWTGDSIQIAGVGDFGGRGMVNLDIFIYFFKKDDDGKRYIKVRGRASNVSKIEGILQSYLQQKVEKAEARQKGRNLRAFTTPGVKEKLNTLPENMSAQLVGFLTGNVKAPAAKVEEIKSVVSKPYTGGRKTRGRRRSRSRRIRRRRQGTRKN